MKSPPTTILAALFLLPFVDAWGCTKRDFDVSVCFEMGDLPIIGARVKCWDDDSGWDDYVGPKSGVLTDSNGCATLVDQQQWCEKPDIYCEIEANGGCFQETLTSTRNNHNYMKDLNFGTIEVTKDDDYCTESGYGDFFNRCGANYVPSWLRDALTDVSGFDAPCIAHDNCYGVCSKTQEDCDDDFYNDMVETCAGQSNCEFLAWQYYQAVVLFGNKNLC